MKLIIAMFVFIMAWSFITVAQVAGVPVPAASAPAIPNAAVIQANASSAVVSNVGLKGWIESHGGFQAAVLLLIGSAFTILSAFRVVLYKYDGVAPGASIPVGYVGLTKLNMICVVLGHVVDFMTGNVAH